MNLIVGATGMVGTGICRLLTTAGKPVKALVRATSDPAKVEKLKSLGATVVQGDLRNGASLKAACQGVSAVITTASAMPFAYKPGENTPQTTILAAEEKDIRPLRGKEDTMYKPFGLMRREPQDGELAREAERQGRRLGIDGITLLALLGQGMR